MTTVIYLAEPIDQAADRTTGVNYTADRIAGALTAAGHMVYRPATAWRGKAAPDPRIERANRAALDTADCVVAHLPQGTPTIGVPMEIERAATRGTPVVVHTTVESFALLAHGTQIEQTASIGEIPALVHLQIRSYPRGIPAAEPLRVTLADGHGLPARHYTDDAGVDLTTTEARTIEPGSFVDIPTEVTGIQTPAHCWAMITGRSSTLRKKGLHVPVAVIDPGWRGPLYIGVWNLSDQAVKVEAGDRLGQVILMSNITALHPLVGVDRLDPHDRGHNGFGSTG